MTPAAPKSSRWLNRTVVGIALASFFSDWSYEIATAAMPVFLASMGAGVAWLGLIEGISDGVSSFAKMGSGYYADRLQRRKPIAVAGYAITAFGIGAFALATNAWHVLAARSTAWLGRGIRTPVRKALLAGAVDKSAYGRAFGFERMMDKTGAIIGPATAVVMINYFEFSYPTIFALTLIPGIMAAAMMAFAVKEKRREPVEHVSFGESLRALPKRFKRFLFGVGLFGMGDFSHTMLILLATQKLVPLLTPMQAAAVGMSLYVMRNFFFAIFALTAGRLADRFDKAALLAGGYLLAGVMIGCVVLLPPGIIGFVIIFMLGGIYVGVEETLEDSLCAELVGERHHGIAFGTMDTINGIGDMVSSTVVGILWATMGATVAFGFSGILFLAGAGVILSLRASRQKALS